MKEIYHHWDSARVGLYRSVLEEEGIPCMMRNEFSGNLCDIPLPMFYPTLCVTNDKDFARACELVKSIHFPPPTPGSDWNCAACGEPSPGNFDACWKCQAARPE